MWKLTWSMMKKNLRMLVPAGLAVAVGCAFIAATFLFGNAMDAQLREQATKTFGDANYVVTMKDGLDETQTQQAAQATVASFRLDTMRQSAGAAGVRPDVSALIAVRSGDASATGLGEATARRAAMLPVDIASGRAPQTGSEIALTQDQARRLSVGIGGTVQVRNAYASAMATPAGGGVDGADAERWYDATVTGLTSDPRGAYAYYGGAAVLSDELMAHASLAPSFDALPCTRVYLQLDAAKANGNLNAVESNLSRLLPAQYQLHSRTQVADKAIASMSLNGVNASTLFLLCFGVLAMLVAALVIANTFQVLVAQRRRMLATLRTIGASKGQLYRCVLLEAGLVGLLASLLGAALATAAMAALAAAGVTFGSDAPMPFSFSWQAIAVPAVFGVAVTMLASAGAARAATAVSPLEALRPAETSERRCSRRLRAVLGIALLAIGIALVSFALLGGHLAGESGAIMMLAAAVLGCAALFIGAVVTAAFWMPVLMGAAGRLAAHAGPSARIAAANISRNPRRIAATGTALLIGVTLVVTMATGAASAKATMDQALDSRYSVDIVAFGGDVSEQDAAKAAHVDGVAASLYAPTASATFDNGGRETSLLIVGVPGIRQLQDVMNVDVSGASLGGDAMVLQNKETGTLEPVDTRAGRLEASVQEPSGARNVDFAATTLDLRGVTPEYGTVGFVDAALFSDGTLQATGHMMLMKADTQDVAAGDVIDALQKAFADSPDVMVSGPIAIRLQWNSVVDSLLALLVGLLAVAVVIALIGVANTLSLSVIERTRESATLRAIGMTRGQLRRSLAAEAAIIALVASIGGVALGTAFGWIGSTMVLSQYADVVCPFDWRADAAIVAIAVLAALAASVLPARRAVRTAPVEALAEAS